MNKVKIKSVIPYAQYEQLIYSYKIICLLPSNQEIVVIDENPYDLTFFIDKFVFIKLATSNFILNSKYDSFTGNIFVSSIDKLFYFKNDDIEVLLPKDLCLDYNLKDNQKVEISFRDLLLKEYKF